MTEPRPNVRVRINNDVPDAAGLEGRITRHAVATTWWVRLDGRDRSLMFSEPEFTVID